MTAHLAAETRRSYARAWRSWESWCLLHEHPLCPADDASLTEYLRGRGAAGCSPGTLRKDLAGIAAGHRARSVTLHCPGTRAWLREVDQRAPRPRQVMGLDWRAVDLIAALTERAGDPLCIRDAALLRVGSDGLMRVGELAGLRVDDLSERGDAMTVMVRATKTRTTRTAYLGRPTARLVTAWLARRPGVRVGSLWAVTAHTVRRVIVARAAAAGIEGRVSGHSLRVGAAQSLAEAGASLVDMQIAGGWASPAMPAHYAAALLAERGAVARLRYRASSAA